MSDDTSRFVDSLLEQRRPRRFQATEADADLMRTAIELRAGQDGGEPSEEFIAGLRDQLAPGTRQGPVRSRRFLVQAAGIAAVAGAAGVGLDRLLSDGQPAPEQPPGAEPTFKADNSIWQTVTTSAELAEGKVREFDVGSISGFVERVDGKLRAVSGVCTHLGCRLVLDATTRRLDCPCHKAVFALTGEIVHYDLPIELPPLPRLAAREIEGEVQVFAPPRHV